MCGHAARQVRAVVTCRRHQCGNKGPLVRSIGDTWAFYCYLASAALVWLIGRKPHRRHGGGKWEVALSPSDFALCFWSRGLLRDPQRRVCSPTLWAVNTAEYSGVFQQHNGPFSHYWQVANHLPGQKSPHLSVSGSVQTEPGTHTFLPNTSTL